MTDGTEYRASKVVSGVDANVTFLKLMDPKDLPAEFAESVRHLDYASGSCKINLALSELPDFTCLRGNTAGPQHHGTIHICPSLEYIERAYDHAKYGYISDNPIIEATIPSLARRHRRAAGQARDVDVHPVLPLQAGAGRGDAGGEQEALRRPLHRHHDRVRAELRKAVLNYEVLSPADIEQRYGLTGGNIMQGTMSLSSLSFMRPVPGYADYRTPIRGLYLCGAATHPGGGVMGACGYNAAREILRDG